jgi:hypothetical protein
MKDAEFPPELVQLEHELGKRPRSEPSADLRRRIVALPNRLEPLSLDRLSFVESALAFAVAVVLCVNLSMSLANQTDYGLGPQFDDKRLRAAAEQIGQLLPDGSPREAFRQALILDAGSHLIPCPRASFTRNLGNLGEDTVPDR